MNSPIGGFSRGARHAPKTAVPITSSPNLKPNAPNFQSPGYPTAFSIRAKVHGKKPIRLIGIHHNMWLDAKPQRRKVIDAAIEVAAHLYKNENLRIDQRLKVISICLPSLYSFSAPLIDWPESDLTLLTAVWVRAYTNAWNLGKSIATCLFTFPREKGGLEIKLPLATLFTSV